MSIEYYDILLKPHGRFFFGGETSFGQADDKDQRRRSYLIQSSILPQQTTLLGMLRYELLKINELLAPYPSKSDGTGSAKEAADLVGNVGFTLPDNWPTTAAKNGFGVIKGISPLRLFDGKAYWQPLPLDDGQEGGKNYHWKRVTGRYWQLENFLAKNEPSLKFGKGSDAKDVDDLFHAHAMTGNRISNRNYREKETAGASGEEGLFRQTFRQNINGDYHKALGKKRKTMDLPDPSDFSFSFRVALDRDTLNKLSNAQWFTVGQETQITLGGEGGQFTMTVSGPIVAENLGAHFESPNYRYNTDLETRTFPEVHTVGANPQSFRRILLLSDTYLPDSLRNSKDIFVMAHAKSFRFLYSSMDKPEQFASIARPAQAPGKLQNGNQMQKTKFGRRGESKLYQLLERGGILIVAADDVENIVTKIHEVEPFHSIGYNYCTYVK